MNVEIIIENYIKNPASKVLLLVGETAKLRKVLSSCGLEYSMFFTTEYIEYALPELKILKTFEHEVFAQKIISKGNLLVLDHLEEISERYSTQAFLGVSLQAHLKLGNHVILVSESGLDKVLDLVIFLVNKNLLIIIEIVEEDYE